MRRKFSALKGFIAAALKELGYGGGTVDINIIGSREMRRLNKKYRGKDKDTNVLAFSPPKKFLGVFPAWLGEIFLNPKYIKNHGEDIYYISLHGLLHLLGFDHKRSSDRIEMEKLEKELYQRITNKSTRIYE